MHENLQPIRPKLFCACFYKPGKIPGVSYITQGGISIHEIHCKEIRLSPSYAASCILFIVLCLFRHTRRCGNPITIAITVIAFLMILVVSIPIGIFTAQHAGGHLDRLIMTINQVIMSVPGFFIGILITYLFGLILKWFQPGAYVPISENFSGFIGYLVAPSAAIALPRCSMAVKMLRSSVLSQLDADYVRTAYSRGNSTRRVMYHHVLKNALIPVLTFWGMTIADIVANSIILEQVFSIPGMGNLLITSISNRDYPVVQGILVLIDALIIIINFVVDLLYGRIDPRIRVKD